MSDESLEGVARGASSILDVVQEFERAGYAGQFAARADGEIECFSCHERMAAEQVESRQLRRLEGASDPDDMLAVAALVCAKCGTSGTLILNYGPTATKEDADVLQLLEQPPPPPA